MSIFGGFFGGKPSPTEVNSPKDRLKKDTLPTGFFRDLKKACMTNNVPAAIKLFDQLIATGNSGVLDLILSFRASLMPKIGLTEAQIVETLRNGKNPFVVNEHLLERVRNAETERGVLLHFCDKCQEMLSGQNNVAKSPNDSTDLNQSSRMKT